MSRRRLVVLGSGFAAISLVKRIDLDDWEVTIVSPRNHFLFTPLLPSTTVGTVEFRSIIEPIRKARKGTDFIQARARSIDTAARTISCDSIEPGVDFTLEYDALVIAVGAENATFGTPGVEKNAVFLRELTDARRIRERLVTCFERADVPGIDPAERERLLHVVVVGGGPTGVEFAAELHDLLEEDLGRSYPDLVGQIRITLFEAAQTILGTFDEELRDYTLEHFRRQGIEVRLGSPVKEVGDGYLELKDGEKVPAGLIVWSTGNAPVDFVSELPLQKERGRLLVDRHLRLLGEEAVYAIGDCAVIIGGGQPQTAQAAMQQGKYLAKALDRLAKGKEPAPFTFKNLGMLAYVGDQRALADIPTVKAQWHGLATYLFWRSAYLTRLVTLKNKILVLFDWMKTWIFGRDLSKF